MRKILIDRFVFKNTDMVYDEERDLISSVGSRHFSPSIGCSIPATASPKNIASMPRAAKGK
jgi:hypothetical protein